MARLYPQRLDAPRVACDDVTVRRLLALLFVFGALVLGGAAAGASTPPVPPSTTEFGYDLERPPSECIGLLPRPDCGREPTQAGDRGGALQYAVFAIMLAGLAVIFTVVFRNVIRADRAKAASADATTAESTTTGSANEQVGAER
jgi:hypothetical protein